MRDITPEVRKKALLYVWDSNFQTREDDDLIFINTFKKFKSYANNILEDYADLLDITNMPEKEVKSVIKGYQRTRYITQLHRLYSERNPNYRAYDDLYFSEQTHLHTAYSLNAPSDLLDIRAWSSDEVETANLVHAGIVYTDYSECNNLRKSISEKLGIDAYKDPHPLMGHILKLCRGTKLHLYTDDVRFFLKDIDVIRKFYKDIPEIKIVAYYH